MSFSSTLTPTPAVGKAIPYTWFTTLLGNTNDLNDRAPSSYSPTWGNSGTANSLGNGTLTGRQWQIGKLVFFQIKLVWGSTTSSGSGTWTFTVPVTADTTIAAANIIGTATDTGTNSYTLHGRMASSTTFDMVTGNPQAIISGTSPHTWANTDTLLLSGCYLAA